MIFTKRGDSRLRLLLCSHLDRSGERNSGASRDVMMRSLLKISDNGRDQGTKTHFIEPRKLQLIDRLTQAAASPPPL